MSQIKRPQIAVENLATAFGALSYRIRAPGERRVHVSLASALAPPGGIALRPPLPGPLRGVEVDGRAVSGFDRDGVVIARGPAEVTLVC